MQLVQEVTKEFMSILLMVASEWGRSEGGRVREEVREEEEEEEGVSKGIEEVRKGVSEGGSEGVRK